MSRVDRDLVRELRTARAPEEAAAEQRAWEVVRSAYAARPARPRARTRRALRLALIPAAVLLAGTLLLTPAGARVHRWIEQTLGVRHARPALFSLPSPGRILVSGAGGTWTVAADGSKRRLGTWPQATWSSHGLYVAVARGDELRAVDSRGATRWSVARPSVRFPRWFAPDGYRLAYLSGASLRVIAGDGTGDHLLAAGVARVAPAWRPGHRYEIGYAGPGRTVVVREADEGRLLWSHSLSSAPRLLAWSASGTHLVVLTASAALVYGRSGHLVASIPARALDAALSPDGRTLALLSDRDVELVALRPDGGAGPPRRLFGGQGLGQLAFSPDGAWLLVSWPAADQWIFLHATGRPRLIAISRIAQQFSPGDPHRQFPEIDGWCCTAAGGTG